jgi:AraC-like DNA-binding protein
VPATDLPFHVIDETGTAHIVDYQQEDYNSITLILDKKIEGRCHIHGAYQQNPKNISYKLGYTDAYSFSKAFKKFYNVPPSRYIKS